MKIIFVQRQIFALPSIASLAGSVGRAGFAADVIIENAEKNFEKLLAADRPDVVGITLTSSDVGWFKSILPRVRGTLPRVFILAGGVHPTIHPALLDECDDLDAICVGEGEEALVDLLDALRPLDGEDQLSGITRRPAQRSDRIADHGSRITGIPNLHMRWRGKVYRNELRHLITDLDKYPENREIYFRRYPQLCRDTLLQYLSSRGCPFPCSFCANEALNRIFQGLGPVHRRKSVDFAIDELRTLKGQYPNAETVFFIDDLFLLDRGWILAFLPRFKAEIGLPFICSAGPKTIDGEIANLLRDSGCASVEFGIETGSEEKRRRIFNKKAFTDSEFRRQIGFIKSRGIEVYAPSMFVFPTETPADSFRTVEFYHELKVDHPFSSFLFPYPDTPIFDIAVKDGCLPRTFRAEDLPGNYFTHSVCRIPRRRLIENIQFLFYFFVKYPRFYRNFRWLVYLPFPLRPVRYLGLLFWFRNWKRMKWLETIQYFWRFRHSK